MNINTIINFVAFQCNWFACVFAAANGMPWLGPVTVSLWLLVHLKIHQQNLKPEFLLALFAGTLGYGLDSLMLIFNVIQFPAYAQLGYLSPLWMVALWLNFAMTNRHSLDWLNKKYIAISLFGGIGGALAYWTGHKIGAIVLPNITVSLAIVFIIWSIALVILYLVSDRLSSLFGYSHFYSSDNTDEHAHL